MEYEATIWNPYLKGDIDKLEKYKTEPFDSSKNITRQELGDQSQK